MSWLSKMNPLSARRKSSEIITSHDLAALLINSESGTGVEVTPSSAMRHAAVYACVKVLAESIGQLPLKVYRDGGESKQREKSHALQKLLRKPNEFQTGQEFWEQCVSHMKLRGNFYAFTSRDANGLVLEMLPFRLGAVTPKLRKDYSVVYEVSFQDGTTDVLGPSQVLHIKNPSVDGVEGLSDIGQLRESIGLGIAMERHGSRLFKNGARPQGILRTAEILDDESFNRIKKSWDDAHGGIDNAHKTAILEAGLEYQGMSMNNQDAQFVDARGLTRSEIAGAFRVPPHKIGDLQHATFSNIEHQAQEFVVDALMPIITRIENRLRVSLFDPVDEDLFAKFTVSSLLRGDMKARADFYMKLQQAGALSPNEIRDLEEMNPRDGGDIYLTPMNMLINGVPPDEAQTNR